MVAAPAAGLSRWTAPAAPTHLPSLADHSARQTVTLYPPPLGTATSTEDECHGFFESCPPGGSCTLVNLNALPPVPMPNTESPANANFYNFMGSGQPLIPYA